MRLTAAVLLGAFLLTPSACRRAGDSDPADQHPGEAWLSPEQVGQSGIVVAPVSAQLIPTSIVSSGRVTFDDTLVTHVFSPVSGRILKVLAQPGERLDRGAPLALMASPDLGQAFSDFVKAKADVAASQSEFQRQKELFEAHAGARRDLEAAENNFRKAEAELDRARQKIALLAPGNSDQVTQDYVLRAPISGEVIARNANPGAEVQGQYSGGTAVELFTIGELHRVWVLSDVYEVDLPKVKRGAVVTVKVVSYPDKSFRGSVDWISGALDPVSHTAKVRCTIENPQKELSPEMYATVSIAVGELQGLAVPRSAILRLGDRTVLFVEKGKSAKGLIVFEPRNVSIRETGGELVPVTQGLAAGERIVTTGAIFLAGML